MRRALLALIGMGLMLASVGCAKNGGCCWGPFRGTCAAAPENCDSCQPQLCPGCRMPRDRCGCHALRQGGEQAAAGPMTGAVAYPYYTTRGPRDFLARTPPRPLGP